MVIQSVLGLFAFLLVAWVLSEKRRDVSIRLVLTGLGMQFFLALILLKIPASRDLFLTLNRVILSLEESTQAGTAFDPACIAALKFGLSRLNAEVAA